MQLNFLKVLLQISCSHSDKNLYYRFLYKAYEKFILGRKRFW